MTNPSPRSHAEPAGPTPTVGPAVRAMRVGQHVIAVTLTLAGIVRGGMYLPPALASRVVSGMRSPRPRLTDREIVVLRLLATGAANKEIARTLFVTEATVKSHLVHIFTKLGVESRARAIHVAREAGLI